MHFPQRWIVTTSMTPLPTHPQKEKNAHIYAKKSHPKRWTPEIYQIMQNREKKKTDRQEDRAKVTENGNPTLTRTQMAAVIPVRK